MSIEVTNANAMTSNFGHSGHNIVFPFPTLCGNSSGSHVYRSTRFYYEIKTNLSCLPPKKV
ncbi:hypothetical protein C8J55DRAFT_501381 [Lentinula edodes]|uniref:Uncharacterized protein n=1 Tax=Lentinula lateritia TaxID=40482 RepID=A0A9W9AZB1_9AGAR|nr:hypothetical protein C8J55DRAFT_501381 [Lentinula edodes]